MKKSKIYSIGHYLGLNGINIEYKALKSLFLAVDRYNALSIKGTHYGRARGSEHMSAYEKKLRKGIEEQCVKYGFHIVIDEKSMKILAPEGKILDFGGDL